MPLSGHCKNSSFSTRDNSSVCGVNSCFKVLLRRANVPEPTDVVEFKFPCKKI